MTKEFEVEIKEALSRIETVGAESLNEATDKAMSLYYDQKIVLYPEDCKGVDFLPFEQITKAEERGGR